MRKILTACIGLLVVLNAAHALADCQIGTGMRVITPDPLLPITGGLGPGIPARQKQGELTARALVVRKGETSLAIVSLDLLGFPAVLSDRVRQRVPRIPAENILIGSTHTHSAPDCYAFPDGKGGHTGDLAYMEMVCEKAAEAVNAAIDNLQPAWIRVETGETQEKIAYNYYAPQLYDRRMSVIQAISPDGKTIATLVNYGIHAEVLGPDPGIMSPDLIGPMYQKIESTVGGMAMFMAGAQGGMITADNRELDRPLNRIRATYQLRRSWDECVRIGEAMASEALRIISDAPVQQDPSLFCGAINVCFSVESEEIWNIVRFSPLNYPHDKENRTITTQVNVVNLGNAQILTVPAEPLPNIGFYLKRKMQGQHNLLFENTNDAFGYMLTKVDFNSFPRYEYVSRTSLGEMTGEIFIEKSLVFLHKCPMPDRPK
ncbi:MAG: hypothetical protein KDA68_13620 [Planctomycetaceae bacterium]|nr:hypothetical protein [Planctomycetaceae bacterium]